MPVPFDHGENMWVSANYVIVNVHILISLYLYFNSIAFHMLIHKHYDLLVFSIQHITCFPKSSQFIHECYFTLYASLLSRRYSYNDLITLHYGKFLDNIATCYRSYFEDWKAYIRDNSRWNYIMLMNFEKKSETGLGIEILPNICSTQRYPTRNQQWTGKPTPICRQNEL